MPNLQHKGLYRQKSRKRRAFLASASASHARKINKRAKVDENEEEYCPRYDPLTMNLRPRLVSEIGSAAPMHASSSAGTAAIDTPPTKQITLDDYLITEEKPFIKSLRAFTFE